MDTTVISKRKRVDAMPDAHLCCVLCKDLLLDPVSLQCGHNFDAKCMHDLLESKLPKRCPICRTSIWDIEPPKVNTTLRTLVEKAFPEAIALRRAEAAEDAKTAATEHLHTAAFWPGCGREEEAFSRLKKKLEQRVQQESDLDTLRADMAGLLEEDIFNLQARLRHVQRASCLVSLRNEVLMAIRTSDAKAQSLAVSSALREGAKVEDRHKQHGPPLLGAIRGRRPWLVTKLLEAGADANQVWEGDGVYSTRTTPLLSAAACGDVEVTRVLMEGGADVRAARTGKLTDAIDTPLMTAAGRGHLDMVKVLLEAGADPNQANTSDPLGIPGVGKHCNPLGAAVLAGNLAVVQTLLAAGADANWTQQPGGKTLLITAAEEGFLEVPLTPSLSTGSPLLV
mmetsp:Transcript_9839/g.20511  ORF Transcript_9839/g.20511 Transcript_9839/m.20511 type:complete len:396 (-) Transcript_9839:197-1384(-)